MAKITAFYGDATSCTKYSLDTIDYQDAITRPDKARWSLSAQSGTIIIDPSVATFPLIARWDLMTGYPNQHGWSPGINGGLSGYFGYSGCGNGAG